MIDFEKYLGKHIVLVTNYTNSPEELFGIRDDKSSIELFNINGQYVCVRPLSADDLKDEDYVQWLNTMWPAEQTLITFIKTQKRWIKRKSR